MSFKSVLEHIGHGILVGLHITEQVAVVAEPFVAVAAPQIVGLYSGILSAAMSAEAAAAGSSGTGAQKLALVLAGQLPNIEKVFADNGIAMPTADINKWASAIVDTIKLIPAPSAANIPTPVTPATKS